VLYPLFWFSSFPTSPFFLVLYVVGVWWDLAKAKKWPECPYKCFLVLKFSLENLF